MGLDLLLKLRDDRVLDPTPIREDLAGYHVPFSALQPGAACEERLDRAVRQGERVAVMGPSGSGKSSLIEFVLHPLLEGVAPIAVQVSTEPRATAMDPAAFARHLVRTLLRHAELASRLSAEEIDTVLSSTGERIHRPPRESVRRVALPFSWLVGTDLGLEVRNFGQGVDQERSGSDTVEQARELVDLVQAHDLFPVVVIDDSDLWLRLPGFDDPAPVVSAFFGPVLRTVANLRCGLVVAVHPSYAEMEGFQQARGFLESVVHVPALPEDHAVTRVIQRRLEAHRLEADVREAFTAPAIGALYAHYAVNGQSLRKMLTTAQSALHHACDAAASSVSESAVDAAVREWAS